MLAVPQVADLSKAASQSHRRDELRQQCGSAFQGTTPSSAEYEQIFPATAQDACSRPRCPGNRDLHLATTEDQTALSKEFAALPNQKRLIELDLIVYQICRPERSPLIVDGKVFIGNEEGTLTVFKASKEKAEILAEKETVNFSAIYSTPTFANNRMYLSDRTRLYAVDVSGGETK